ncbi:SDR family NAD(P)-dependent oxidoreductase [Nocardia rhamnosiphila]|uniref:SDR family NAD(P)-dependent oxidoreductase n=1 Tax=Nocardia rhamnosiphila TaxID=426716 RepID=UPI0033EC6FA6
MWFVTGVGRGLGRGIAEAALEAGRSIVGTVRRDGDGDGLTDKYGDRALVVTADVTDPAAVRTAVDRAMETFGRIDVLVNNAGYTLVSGVEDASDQEIRRQFETNTFGTIDVTRAVLPIMRARGSGRVIMVSSVAGAAVGPGMAYYGATKHAVEGFAEGLSKEVTPLGIRVSIVQPGLFRTDALGSSMHSVTPASEYQDSVGALMGALSKVSSSQPGDPFRLGEAIVKLVDSEDPPLRVPVDPGATGSIQGRLELQLAELREWGPRLATEPIG